MQEDPLLVNVLLDEPGPSSVDACCTFLFSLL
jgi:hypothetical protein